ncbi:RNase P/MRP, p29 subunit [Thozetella sp. PMI_491]|nr:RNase P/MRP, p29 subunit [Thozetella sp. PMI_491]
MAPKDQPIAQALLARAHSPDSAARLFNEKIQYRPIHLRPSSPPPSNVRDARRKEQEKQRQQRKKALKPKPLSAGQRRRLGLYDVPREGQKYAIFEPLHQLWIGYIGEILGREVYTGGEGAASKLCSADFHGAEVEVVRSTCVSRVGIKGIVIKDSKFALEVITRKNKLKLVPKEGTVFRIEVPSPEGQGKAAEDSGYAEDNTNRGKEPRLVFEIHGDQFMYRSADRASRKFKNHFSKSL